MRGKGITACVGAVRGAGFRHPARFLLPYPRRMSAPEIVDPLQRVQAYRLAVEAMRDARVDAGVLRKDVVMRDAIRQLVRAAGSIASTA